MKFFNILLIVLIISTFSLHSQSGRTNYKKSITGAENKFAIDTLAVERAAKNAQESIGIVERAINEEEYQLGPGDELTINILTYEPIKLSIKIGPDGNLLIPGIGALNLNDKILKDAKAEISKKIISAFPDTESFISLTDLKKFKVRVSGSVSKSQIITASAADRVSEIIDRAGGLNFDASIRNIKLFRTSENKVINVDLEKFYKMADESSNPYVRGGDHIRVNPENPDLFIQAAGALVIEDLQVEFAEGDSLSTLVKLAQGFLPSAKIESIEFSRYNNDTKSINKEIIDLSAWKDLNLFGNLPLKGDFALKPGDRIFVREQFKWLEKDYVVIEGEVKYPGKYSINDGEIHLSEIIKFAGGLTNQASLISAQIIRQEELDQKDEELDRLSRTVPSEMSESELRYYQVRIREKRGAMAVDFPKAINEPYSDNDILLNNRDSIVIPRIKNYINIQGRVASPGAIPFKKGYTYLDYIELAGGFTSRADENETFVTKSTGEQFLADEENYVLEPGDVILIPPKPETDFWPVFFEWFTFVTQIVTVASVIITVSR